MPSAELRFWRRVTKSSDAGGCWIWRQGAGSERYGEISIDGRTIGAHRYSWILHNGPIPAGRWVLHNCPGGDNPRCVNPAHLWLGTHAENAADYSAKYVARDRAWREARFQDMQRRWEAENPCHICGHYGAVVELLGTFHGSDGSHAIRRVQCADLDACLARRARKCSEAAA